MIFRPRENPIKQAFSSKASRRAPDFGLHENVNEVARGQEVSLRNEVAPARTEWKPERFMLGITRAPSQAFPASHGVPR